MVCSWCHRAFSLVSKSPRQPVNSLANFQYYAHERLPPLIPRASQIVHHYAYKPSSGSHWTAEEASQRYNKGNVAVRAQDSTELRILLLPSPNELHDAMCVPTRETIKSLRPVMVTKSRVRQLIHFLLEHNPWYQHSGVCYSPENMDSLFDAADGDVDRGVPRALQICHLPDNAEEESHIDYRVSETDVSQSNDFDSNNIVMEAVGYTKGDHSSASREKMKLHALALVMDKKKFLLSRTSSQFVADNDPGLMSYLFPHLDPWDIGGFFTVGGHVNSICLWKPK
ncbi:hypothetical protein C8R48DRAFT_749168 [Suillus tomentosus]|nr:hypothetical protein C8R48DRAFT_749168 [Suillus tomentosus]